MKSQAPSRAVLEERILQMERRHLDRFASLEKVTEEKSKGLSERLEGMNEFRRQLDRRAVTFVTWWQVFTVSGAISALVVGLMEILIKVLKR